MLNSIYILSDWWWIGENVEKQKHRTLCAASMSRRHIKKQDTHLIGKSSCGIIIQKEERTHLFHSFRWPIRWIPAMDKKKYTSSSAFCAVTPVSTGSLSYPKLWVTSWIRSALWRWGMCWQEAMAWRLELRTSGAKRRSWKGLTSHKSGLSMDTSSVVSLDKLFPCKYTANILDCCCTQ